MIISLVVAGSRSIKDYKIVDREIRKLVSEYNLTNFEIVTGHAIGVDSMAESWAHNNGMNSRFFLPDYDDPNYDPKIAPLKRNEKMADYGDLLLCIWDGESRGTCHMLNQMKKRGKPYRLVKVEKKEE